MEHPRRGGSAPKEKTRRKGGQPGMPGMFMGWPLAGRRMHAWQAACTTSESGGGRTMAGFGLCSNIARLKESVSGQGRLRPRLFGVELSIPGADGTYWVHHLTVHTWRSGVPFDRTATRSVTDEVRYFAGQRQRAADYGTEVRCRTLNKSVRAPQSQARVGPWRGKKRNWILQTVLAERCILGHDLGLPVIKTSTSPI